MDASIELRPRSVGDLLAGAFEVYRRRFLTFLAIAAIVVVPLTLVQYYVARELVGVTGTDGATEIPSDAWRVAGASLLLGILGFIVFQLLTGAMTRAAVGVVVGETPTVGESYEAAGARLGSIALAAILTGLAAFVGFLLLVIPGFIVLVHLIVTIPAVVVERRRGGEALSRSWALVRGHGWRVFGTILVGLLLVGIAQGIVAGPVQGGWLAEGLAAAVASVITLPYTTALTVLIYLDLRTRKEALDGAALRAELGRGAS